MRNGLFREQAVRFQANRLHGEVIVLPHLSVVVITSLLLVWLGCVISFLFSSEYSRQATVTGWLEPPRGVIKIHADASGGRVKTLLVKEGQFVEKGQTLMVIDRAASFENGTLEETLLKEYQSQIELLTQQIARAKASYKQEQELLLAGIHSLQKDAEQLDSMQILANERLNLASAAVAALLPLVAKNHVAQQEIASAKASELSIKQDLQQLQRDRLNTQQALKEKRMKLAALPDDQANAIAALQSTQSDIHQRMAQVTSQKQRVIKASQSGIVTNLHAVEGQSTTSGAPLVALLPQHSHIEARLLIPVRAAGFVRSGQRVDIRYDAFPYQKFGLHKGEVISISSTVVLPGDVAQTPAPINEPVYLVKAVLDSQHITAYGQQITLKSGMTLSADISLSHRSLVEWLFEPLLSLAGRL